MDIIMKWILLSRPSEVVLGTRRSKKYIFKTAEKDIFSQRLSTDPMGTCRTTCSNEMNPGCTPHGQTSLKIIIV